MLSHEWWVYALASVVSVLGVGRMLRLLTYDDFPPVKRARDWYLAKVGTSPWKQLATCPFCLGPYAMVVSFGWAWLSDLHWTWWVAHLFAGLSYLAAILVAYDQPE